MNSTYPTQPEREDGGELLSTLRDYFGPREEAFLRALHELRLAIQRQIRAQLGQYTAPEHIILPGACGYVVQAIRDAVAELDLAEPIVVEYGVPKDATAADKGHMPPYHYWLAVGQGPTKVVVDGAQPHTGKLLVLPEAQHAALSAYTPYIVEDDADESPHAQTVRYLRGKQPKLVGDFAGMPVDIVTAYCALANIVSNDEDTMVDA